MTEKMMNRLADLRTRQQAGEHLLCPRCGQDTMKRDVHTNALSRHADGIYVCDSCGTAEALLDFMHQQLPLTQWALFRPLRPASGFKSMDPLDVAAQIEADQIEKLKDTFSQCLRDPENAEEYRASAFESCPGLTELWIQPFMAKYDTKADPVVVRFHLDVDSGESEYSIDLVGGK